MIYLARCPVCKSEIQGFFWTATKSGKKWLRNSNGEWHDCPMSNSSYGGKKERVRMLIDTDYDFCHDCGRFFIKKDTRDNLKLGGDTLEKHIEVWHPNGEILDDIDYMALSESEKEKVREKWNMPKSTKRYNLKGKFVERV